MAEKYTYPNESYSGCDMVATILMPDPNTGKKIVYALGEMQTISYSIHMDRKPVRSIGNINAKDYVMGPRTIAGSLVFAVFNKHFANKIMKDVGEAVKSGYAFLIDELPPFDIIISMANEYGQRSRQVLYGVRLVNEGQVMSINDIYTENTYQFVATDLEYLTDETGSSSYANNSQRFSVVEASTINTVPTANTVMNEEADKNTSSVELKYRILNDCTDYTQGRVQFFIIPAKRHGIIKVLSENYNVTIDIAALDEPGKIIIQLPEGKYSAIWVDDISKDKSNTVNFEFIKNTVSDNNFNYPPIIEFITNTTITVMPNVKEHSHVIYEDSEGNNFMVKVSGKRAQIANLTPGSTYKISSCNSTGERASEKIIATTLGITIDMFNDFLLHLKYNAKKLKNNDFKVYEKIVYDGRNLYYNDSKKFVSICEIFGALLNDYNNKINGLKEEDFTNIVDYFEELEKLKALYNGSIEIVAVSSKISNDKVYGYNKEFMVVEQPILEYGNYCTDTLIVNNNINNIDFFKCSGNSMQFIKTINRSNFIKIENTNYSICKFYGKPNTKYSTYAYNDFGFKSPRLDFFIFDDLNKSLMLQRESEVNSENEYKFKRAQLLYSNYSNEYISDGDKKRVLIEISKDSPIKLLQSPYVSTIDDKSITIETDEPVEFLKNNEIKLVLSDLSNALSNEVRYKIDIDSINNLTVADNGLRDGSTYAIWLEDNEENQISNCNTFVMSKGSSNEEVNTYYTRTIVDSLKKHFEYNDINNRVLNSLLNNNYNQIDNTRYNTLDNILYLIIENFEYIDNISDVLYVFFVFYMNTNFTYEKSFFNESPIYNRLDNSISVPENVTAYIFKIASYSLQKDYETIAENGNINLNNGSRYTFITFIKNDLSQRSGFILVDNISKKIKTYKMKVEVNE